MKVTLALEKYSNCYIGIKEDKSINTSGTYFKHLRFADDIVLVNSNIQELAKVLDVMAETASNFGSVKMTSKTKTLSNSEEDIYSQYTKLENVA